MQNEFIPYEQALALKELEFDDDCFGFYDTFDYSKTIIGFSDANNSAPTFSQAFRWFRKNHNLHCEIQPIFNHDMIIKYYRVRINDATKFELGMPLTYEEAELECLKKIIEITEKYVRIFKNPSI
jgi:hypothetical protein